jgi:sigma-E factor negative regulatory protein RseA
MNQPMHRPADERRAHLSALADGEAPEVDPGCRWWREDAEARATWHAYHLIGDVMRSDDLAGKPARDARLLKAVRERLAAEPAIVAPSAAHVSRRRQRWTVPVAAAAGFAAVAGVVVVLRSTPEGGGAVVAAGPATAAAPAGLRNVVVRDPLVDQFLDAHRRAGRGGLFAMPAAVPAVQTLAPSVQASATR